MDKAKLNKAKQEEYTLVSLHEEDKSERMQSSDSTPNNSETFTRDTVFDAASQGDVTKLNGLLQYLQNNNMRLTSPEFTDVKVNEGKTALMKALLNLKDGRNDTVGVFLHIARKTGDLEKLINASYTHPRFTGQTALHIAIEKRSLNNVELLVRNGANVQAKANGTFFQDNEEPGFYFGELPLSLAACTNQPRTVSFLMDNPHSRADLTDKDSQGNTVLHTLVVIADNTKENTDMISKMYDHILIQNKKLRRGDQLETLKNNKGLTPLKLAAKLGKIELFKHILHRKFSDEEMGTLCRKFTDWDYGPVHSSLYDTTSIDTTEDNSVLKILVFGGDIPNRPEMLQIEPLRSLLKQKWNTFASKIFLMHFLVYVMYLIIFTAVAFNRKEGKPPFPIEDFPRDHLRCTGEIITVLGALWFLYKAISVFKRNPPNLKALYTDGFSDFVFFLQAILHLICTVLYICGQREYVCLLVLSLVLAWINTLYYLRGSRQLGVYSVMMQRVILGDLFNFLCVYGVLLCGFSAAIIALMEESPLAQNTQSNGTHGHGGSSGVEPLKSSYHDVRFTTLEMFKFTIGMGDLELMDHIQYKEVFYILLILYIVLTYILLLNMLIALMGHTVQVTSEESENIWKLQWAVTILDIEKCPTMTLLRCLTKLKPKPKSEDWSGLDKVVNRDDNRVFVRVEEVNWKDWSSDLEEGKVEPVRHENYGNWVNHSPTMKTMLVSVDKED